MQSGKMVRVSSKGQVVLPKRVRERAGISEGDYIQIRNSPDGKVLIEKPNATSIDDILERFQKAVKARNFTREDLEAAKGRIRLVIPVAVIEEAREVIARKIPEVLGELEEFLERVDWEPVEFPPAAAVEAAKQIIRDPKDAPILASATIAKPDYLISGDKHFHTDEVLAVAPVIRCSDFLRRLRNRNARQNTET